MVSGSKLATPLYQQLHNLGLKFNEVIRMQRKLEITEICPHALALNVNQ